MDIRMKVASQRICSKRLTRVAGGVLFLMGCIVGSSVQAQTTPSALVLQSKTVTTINGNAGHVAANNAGDAFYVSQTDNTAYWVKRGTTTPIAILTGLSGGRSVYVDSSNNIYIPSNYSGTISEIPYVAGTYATGSALGSLGACSSSTPTTPCNQFGNGGSGVSYYYQATDLAFDASGKAYVADEYNNGGLGGPNTSNAIEVFSLNGVSYAAKLLVNGLPHTSNAQIAVDAGGDIFYVDGTNLGMVAAGGSTLVPFGTGFVAPSGVSVDKYGNLYVTDSSLDQIIEFPAVNGVPQTNKQFVFDPVYSANGVGLDNVGDMYYTGYSGGTNLNVARINSFNLGQATLGSPASGTATTLTVSFVTAQTLGALTLSGGSSGFTYLAGTCAAGTSYTATQSCTFNVNYTPNAVGLQKGAVVISNASGAVIATAELSGTGLGAVQTTDPATVSTIGSGFSSPQGIVVDGAKDVFIADAGKNAVYEYAAGSTTPVSVGSGLSGPTSVALDNAGNLFIADSGNGRVVEVPVVAGVLSTSAQTVVATGLGSTLGVATDAYGDLYIADTNNNKVLQYAPINGTPSSSASSRVTLPTASAAPLALATDGTGDLFVADTTANTVTEIAYYGKTLTNIGNGYLHPSGLATDAAGNLYVADPGNIRLIKIPYEAPNYNPNDQYSVGPAFSVAAGVSIPFGVAVDSSANLYVVDNKNAEVSFLNRQQGTLSLGSSNVGTATAQQNSYIGSAGNQSLTLGTPAYATTPNAAFTVTSPSTGGCTNSQTLLPGFACVLQATFDPPALGNYTQTLAFNSNAANTTTPQLTLLGAGVKVAATTLSLQQTSPAGQAAFGQTVVITSTISSTTAGTPSGDVIFYVDGNFYSAVKVTGSTQTLSINGLLGGSHTIAASYTGDTTFASSSTTLTIIVVKANSSLALTAPYISQYPDSAPIGGSVQLIAIVTPNAITVPTGTVTFTLGTVTLGTATVVNISGSYQATITTSALAPGNNTVVASYGGDVNYFPSQGTLLIVSSPQTFTLTPATQQVTATQAQNVQVAFQLESLSGFGTAYISMTCAGLPANTTCGFNPNGFPLQAGNLITAAQTNILGNIILVPATYGPMNVTLNITTGLTPVVVPPGVTASLRRMGVRGGTISLAFFALAPITLLLRRRAAKHFRKSLRIISLALLFAISITSFSGCGSNLIGVTPAGTYQIAITATATESTGYKVPPAGTAFPAGCGFVPNNQTTSVTCVQTAQITLVVKPSGGQ